MVSDWTESGASACLHALCFDPYTASDTSRLTHSRIPLRNLSSRPSYQARVFPFSWPCSHEEAGS